MAGKSGLAFFFAHGLGCDHSSAGWKSAAVFAYGHGYSDASAGWTGHIAFFAYGHGCGRSEWSKVSIFSYGSGKCIRVIWLQHRIVFAYGPRVGYSGAG